MKKVNRSNLIGNLALVYQQLGGTRTIASSSYFWLAIILSALFWRTIWATDDAWVEIGIQVIPALAGFSIAAFALLFSAIDNRTRIILSKPSDTFGGRSPFLMISSTVSFAIIVQMFTLLYTIVYSAKPLPDIFLGMEVANRLFSIIGVFGIMYGNLLVLAAVLTIFKILELIANHDGKKSAASVGQE